MKILNRFTSLSLDPSITLRGYIDTPTLNPQFGTLFLVDGTPVGAGSLIPGSTRAFEYTLPPSPYTDAIQNYEFRVYRLSDSNDYVSALASVTRKPWPVPNITSHTLDPEPGIGVRIHVLLNDPPLPLAQEGDSNFTNVVFLLGFGDPVDYPIPFDVSRYTSLVTGVGDQDAPLTESTGVYLDPYRRTFTGAGHLYVNPFDSTHQRLGAGDFSIEIQVLFGSSSDTDICKSGNVSANNPGGWQLFVEGSELVFKAPPLEVRTTFIRSMGISYLIEVSRAGPDLYIFVNGVLATTTTSLSSHVFTEDGITIGDGLTGSLLGTVSKARVTVGVARHTSSYMSTADPFPTRLTSQFTSVVKIYKNGSYVGDAYVGLDSTPGLEWIYDDPDPLASSTDYQATISFLAYPAGLPEGNLGAIYPISPSTGLTAIFLDTFSYGPTGPIPPNDGTPEIGFWQSSNVNIRAEDGVLYAISNTLIALAETISLFADNGEYTVEVEFATRADGLGDGVLKVALTDGNSVGDLTQSMEIIYDNGVTEIANLDVDNGDLVSYGEGPSIDLVPGTTHTLTMQLKPNFYNFKLDGSSLGMFGAVTLYAETFINPKLVITIDDNTGATTPTFTITRVAVYKGVIE